MAALASMIAYPAVDTTFVSDCSSALGCASGTMTGGSSRAQSVLRAMHVLRVASSGGVVQYLHTHSHQGEFANEVVDPRVCLIGEVPFPDADSWFLV